MFKDLQINAYNIDRYLADKVKGMYGNEKLINKSSYL